MSQPVSRLPIQRTAAPPAPAARLGLGIATLAALLLLLSLRPAAASPLDPPPIVLTDEEENYTPGPSVALLFDAGGALTLADVSSPELAARWAVDGSSSLRFAFAQGAVWSRFAVRNDSARPLWLIDLGSEQQDYIDYYLVWPDGQFAAHVSTGAMRPFSTRDVPSVGFVFQAPVPAGESATVYIRTVTSLAADPAPAIRSPRAFTARTEANAMFLGLLYGAFALLALYCLAKAIAQRDPLYGILAGLLVGQVITFAARDGWAARLLWPNNPAVREVVIPLALAVTLLMFLQYASQFLELKRLAPRLRRVIRGLGIAVAAAALLVVPMLLGVLAWRYVMLALIALAAPVLVAFVLAGALAWKQGFPPARYYTIAWLVPLAFGILDLGVALGLLPRVDFISYAPKLGSLLFVVMLSVAAGRASADAVATATSRERSRLARELHDSVTQTLFSANIIAEMTQSQLDDDPQEARRSLDKLVQLTSAALAEMRSLLMELRPAALQAAPLAQLMENLSQAAAARSRVRVSCEMDGEEPPMSPDTRVGIYRIAQELINNVIKHSAAQSCLIRITFVKNGLVLVVRDDGKGFDPAHVSPEHLGLAIMRERARAIGGELEICSEPGHGTIAELRWGAATEGAWL